MANMANMDSILFDFCRGDAHKSPNHLRQGKNFTFAVPHFWPP